MSPVLDVERLQKLHYGSLATHYERYYCTPASQEYRNRFINRFLIADLDIKNWKVLEAMCGSGQTTGFLMKHGALVTGLDISSECLGLFRSKWPYCGAVCSSVLKTPFPNSTFDLVVVVGGLHHLHPFLHLGVEEICRVLKPGGYFCFSEPHLGSLPDVFRKLWYRFDGKIFASNEKSVDLEALRKDFSDSFRFKSERFVGNIAYLLVFHAMVLRVPAVVVRILARPLLRFEATMMPLQGRRISCIVDCQWQKK